MADTRPIKLSRVDLLNTSAAEVCELGGPVEEHRGEIYELSAHLASGVVVKLALCRHHVRMAHHVLRDA